MIARNKKEAMVLGLGRSGMAAAKLLIQQGWEVTVLDEVVSARLTPDMEALRSAGTLRLLEGRDEWPKGNFALAVISPGISDQHPWALHCREEGVPLVSELELGWHFCSGQVLAVTGSNGKTTVVTFCEAAMRMEGLKVMAAGNIGMPLCQAVLDYPAQDWYVVEVSSFQLEHVYEFRPEVGILLNIHPNHLDRHGDQKAYRAAKLNLFKNMSPNHHAVIHQNLADGVLDESEGSPTWISFASSPSADYGYSGSQIMAESSPVLNISNTYFDHPIYGENLAAACAALDAVGIKRKSQQMALRDFKGLPHRFEELGERNGVLVINDSKSTNLSATAAALRASDRPVHLIAGGVLKESNVNSLKEILVRQAACVYLIGDSAEQLLEAWMPFVPCVSCDTLDNAVHAAWQQAKAGETILLSPGCASFDQFNGYEERGEVFRKLIGQVTVENAS
jgi:UDP-N-acetylmuramoylalanine--D-glutamate ligase